MPHDVLVDPDDLEPVERIETPIDIWRPSARTAMFEKCQATARDSAIRAIVKCYTTNACNAQTSAARNNSARSWAAAVMSCRQTRPHPTPRFDRILTSKIVGSQPIGFPDNLRSNESTRTDIDTHIWQEPVDSAEFEKLT